MRARRVAVPECGQGLRGVCRCGRGMDPSASACFTCKRQMGEPGATCGRCGKFHIFGTTGDGRAIAFHAPGPCVPPPPHPEEPDVVEYVARICVECGDVFRQVTKRRAREICYAKECLAKRAKRHVKKSRTRNRAEIQRLRQRDQNRILRQLERERQRVLVRAAEREAAA